MAGARGARVGTDVHLVKGMVVECRRFFQASKKRWLLCHVGNIVTSRSGARDGLTSNSLLR